MTDAHCYLTDVLLETGFTRMDGMIDGTETALHNVEIRDGRIASVHKAGAMLDPAVPRHSAGGQLLLPATRDMHIHLDKTFFGLRWKAPLPRQGTTIMDMIARERQLIPHLLPTSVERAEMLIDLLLSKGTTFARSHCNIDPVSGLKSLEHLQRALENQQHRFACEIVAFPQHGLLHSQVEGLMREAMEMGAHLVGGLDPTNVDKAMQRSLDTMFQIAIDFNAGVDIHLHESSSDGVAAVEYMVATVERTPQLKGRLTLSHAIPLSVMEDRDLNAMAERMADQGIDVASTVMVGTTIMPLPQLRKRGVRVLAGTDSVTDHWSPFGTADMVEKASIYSQMFGGGDEFRLSRALGIATGGVLPLDDEGHRVWPGPDDAAELMLVPAVCSAQVVARRIPRSATFHEGRLVQGTLGPS